MSTLPAFTRTATDIVAEVLMTRSAFSGVILLVEGPSDSRFLKRHILANNSQITICGGKQTALSAMTQMNGMALTGYLAVLDRDFDDHKGILPGRSVFYTDTHDIETLLLSVHLHTLLAELGDEQKIEIFEQQTNQAIAAAVLERAEAFGKMRFLSEVKPALKIGMGSFSPWKYIEVRSWTLDEIKLQTDYAAACGRTHQAVLALLAVLPPLKTWRDAHGHDALAILSIGLRQILGGRQVSEDQLCSYLRLAFNEYDFRQTQLYADLKSWQEAIGLPFLKH